MNSRVPPSVGCLSRRALPECESCGSTAWGLECELRILIGASSEDPAGPFRRETAVDSLHTLIFYCCDCGECASRGTAHTLAAIYRSHSDDRQYDPAQGNLLAQFGKDADEIVPVRPPAIVRRPQNSGGTSVERGR